MSNHKGSEGSVMIGANTVAEINGWSIEETADTMEDTNLDETARTFQSGATSWSGSIDCFWDETNTTGQGAMAIGALVTLNLYPEGNVSTDVYYTGSAIINGISRQAAKEGFVEASYSFQGTGLLIESAVV